MNEIYDLAIKNLKPSEIRNAFQNAENSISNNEQLIIEKCIENLKSVGKTENKNGLGQSAAYEILFKLGCFLNERVEEI